MSFILKDNLSIRILEHSNNKGVCINFDKQYIYFKLKLLTITI
jgi:hypothetical protein